MSFQISIGCNVRKSPYLECASCHETQVFTDAQSACASCHVEDDPHKGVFANDCESCHNPVAWDYWMFDHKAQTSFLLEGAHKEVSCSNCHRRSLAAMRRLGTSCGDCHRADDVHDGEFGFDCGRCHDDQSFENVRSLPSAGEIDARFRGTDSQPSRAATSQPV